MGSAAPIQHQEESGIGQSERVVSDITWLLLGGSHTTTILWSLIQYVGHDGSFWAPLLLLCLIIWSLSFIWYCIVLSSLLDWHFSLLSCLKTADLRGRCNNNITLYDHWWITPDILWRTCNAIKYIITTQCVFDYNPYMFCDKLSPHCYFKIQPHLCR